MSTPETAKPDLPAAESPKPAPVESPQEPPRQRPWKLIIVSVVVLIALIAGTPVLITALHTVSTDDAYVNGHVTFVAPRVPGQVLAVYADDNNRVRKGDLLLRLDPEPNQVQVNIAQSAVSAAQADLVAARAQVRGMEGQTRSLRFFLEHAIEDVDDQVAQLRSKVASLQSQKATLEKAQADYDRAVPLIGTGAITKDEVDLRKEALLVAKAKTQEARWRAFIKSACRWACRPNRKPVTTCRRFRLIWTRLFHPSDRRRRA